MNKKLGKILGIILIILVLFLFYSIGRFHGFVNGALLSYQFDDMCNRLGGNMSNDVCHYRNGTKNVEFNEHLISGVNDTDFNIKFYGFLFTGKWLEIEDVK